jgi:hypothetical protein
LVACLFLFLPLLGGTPPIPTLWGPSIMSLRRNLAAKCKENKCCDNSCLYCENSWILYQQMSLQSFNLWTFLLTYSWVICQPILFTEFVTTSNALMTNNKRNNSYTEYVTLSNRIQDCNSWC